MGRWHVLAWLLGIVALFLLIEGLFSTLYVISNFRSVTSRAAGPALSQYDPELGWTNTANFYSQDFYGPGIWVKTNSQGFRNSEAIDSSASGGRVRVICSGDSFTFGNGVDNDHAWCAQLAALDHRLQPVNMGVAGYGVDQMYLLHQREAQRMDYNIHVLAVIVEDFKRMQRTAFLGYGKPMLKLNSGELIVSHVPVPKPAASPRWTFWGGHLLSELRSVAYLQKMLHRTQAAAAAPPQPANVASDSTREVAAKVLAALAALDRQKGATLLVLYLPTLDELETTDTAGTWRGFLREECARQGIAFLDLTSSVQQLPYAEMLKLYIPITSHSAGHLSDAGNAYAAAKLYHTLSADPSLSAKLSRPQ